MKDLKKFRDLMKDFGVQTEEYIAERGSPINCCAIKGDICIDVQEGNKINTETDGAYSYVGGYGGFYFTFIFDRSGNFKGIAIFE